jgi:hypothetical protein
MFDGQSLTLLVRPEREADFDAVRRVVEEAFARAEHTDGDEHNLVDRLRRSEEYIPSLSLVAEVNGEIVGYVMFSRIYVGNAEAVALAPLAVLPAYQNKGIGRALICDGHRRAMKMGYGCSVVLGSPDYYSKCGFLPASQFGITAPFEIPSQFYMVYPMTRSIPGGRVRYSAAFGL